MMGYTSQEGYEHESSKAIRGDQFCGLLCDEINQDDLSEERVGNWVAQLTSDGFLDGSSGSTDAVSVQVVEASSSDNDQVTQLRKENDELRKMLEENSKFMDDIMQTQGNSGYTPHYNPKRGVTMWTSTDGRKCYYTTDQPRNP
jgi:flavodoxin I